uniref:ORC ubiquitin ligase 1 n=1 Tax=Leptobrachium leishanense TaxID=445787 RepID=A0A8C5LQJ1_9ANUR
MAQSVQSVTLALTLPITCHICLAKVRQPVVCANHHVFCSVCIELWLKNNNQCPACRVPITPENPCKDIIGGSSEDECVLSHSIRKHLRKTRLEILHKEYEDEIETLVKETEGLKRANNNLEKKLSECVTPTSLTFPSECVTNLSDDKNGIDAKTLEEILKKLQAATNAITKFTGDNETLKAENKKLRNENIEFGRENLRLKSEVVGRSPQKFGRFTVAALQAKVDQYEREMSRLKKALERSDQYIEELEGQVAQLKQPSGVKQEGRSNCEENGKREEAEALYKWQDVRQTKVFPKQTHEFLEGEAQRDSRNTCLPSNGCTSSLDHTNMFAANTWSVNLEVQDGSEVNENCSDNAKWKRSLEKDKVETCTPSKGRECLECSSPSNSLLPLGFLQLNTPNIKDVPSVQKPIVKKPLTFLRKLVFDDLRKSEMAPRTGENKSTRVLPKSQTHAEPSNALFLKCQQGTQKEHHECDQPQITEPVGSQRIFRSHHLTSNDDPCGIVSDEFIDTAYFDKVNELHFMMSDSDNSKSLPHSSSQVPSKNPDTIANEQQTNNDAAIEKSLCTQSCNPQRRGDPLSIGSSTFPPQSSWKMSPAQTNYEFRGPEFLSAGFQADAVTMTFQSPDPLAHSNGDLSAHAMLTHDLPKSDNSPAKRKLPSQAADCLPKLLKH